MVRLRRRFSLRLLVMGPPCSWGWSASFWGCGPTRSPTMLVSCCFFGLGNGLLIGSSLNYVYRLAPRPPQSQRPGLFRRGLFCGGYSWAT